jgi:hypothetical protein
LYENGLFVCRKVLVATLMVPSNAMLMLVPALTPPNVRPSVVGGRRRSVPDVEMVLPEAGAPRPGPARTAVTVPTLLVERTPLLFTESPGPTETTPKELVVATGKETPGKVCAGEKTITPVIVPPTLGRAAEAVTWAACAAV